MVRAIPDVLVRSHAEVGTESLWESLSHEAVHAIRGNYQIAFEFQRLKILNLSAEPDFDAKLFTAPLEDLQQTQTSDSGKAIAMNYDLFAAMNDVDIVPGRKVPRNFGVRDFIGGAQIRQSLSGEHDAPTKSIVRAIA